MFIRIRRAGVWGASRYMNDMMRCTYINIDEVFGQLFFLPGEESLYSIALPHVYTVLLLLGV